MRISTKILLATVFGFGTFQTATYAAQLPSHTVTTLHAQSSTQLAEADSPNDSDSGAKEDGDREASDVRKAQMTRTHRSRTEQPVTYHRRYRHKKKQQTVLR
jgi:uncharacterized protein YciW